MSFAFVFQISNRRTLFESCIMQLFCFLLPYCSGVIYFAFLACDMICPKIEMSVTKVNIFLSGPSDTSSHNLPFISSYHCNVPILMCHLVRSFPSNPSVGSCFKERLHFSCCCNCCSMVMALDPEFSSRELSSL